MPHVRDAISTASTKTTLDLGDVTATVVRKNIKGTYLRLKAPEGRVEITTSLTTPLAHIRDFLREKTGWIRKQQARARHLVCPASPTYTTGEMHYVLGQRRAIQIVPTMRLPTVTLTETLNLHIDPALPTQARANVLEGFYRTELQKAITQLFDVWVPRIGVAPQTIRIKTMKSRWGSCHTTKRQIHLNLALIHTPPQAIEYVFVHEMVHLLVPNHGPDFQAYMTKYLPEWRKTRRLLHAFALC